jgi:DUF1680 family protein
LDAKFNAKLLGGVTTIDTEAFVRPSGQWDRTLYRPLEPKSESTIRVQLIPYFAWSNRGPSEMSVWLPVR